MFNDLTGAAGLLILIVFVVSGFWLILRKSGVSNVNFQSESVIFRQEIKEKNEQLVVAQNDASKFEALASERKHEIERLNGDLSKLRIRIDEKIEEQTNLSKKVSELETRLHVERTASEEKIAMQTKIHENMEAKFKELAAEALQVQGEQFSKANFEKLNIALAPLKEHVGHFEQELREAHKATIEDRATLKVEIEQLSKRSETISHEALALTRALKGNQQKQGAWGEMILENILERSGLRVGEEYQIQVHRVSDEGDRLRPDVIVNIPGGKTLVIDSKVSLTAYTDVVNSEDENTLVDARKRHLMSIRSHIDNLAAKGYQFAEDSTVDYVILFVPIEGALSEALRIDGHLTEYALEKDVTIATPTTLMMALKTIAHVWAVERRSQNAEAIAERAGRIYDKVVGFIDNMKNLGKRLDQAQDAYQDAFGQLSNGHGNLLSHIDRLKKLGARTSKSINVSFDNEKNHSSRIERD
ncbi:MAG: DNA recombination protein RmuC [Aestuariivita sp.]|nr:DNA recombination protein RmuC [Aestuariivita sp.]